MCCFNGAAALQRRKLQYAERYRFLRCPASMGPPLFSDGNPRHASLIASQPVALQWGRRSSATETTGTADVAAVTSLLQWGRRSSATETATASMMRPVIVKLQWGRRSSATETSSRMVNSSASCSLQWGRRSSATETRFPPLFQQFTRELQWGRRSSATETRDDDAVPDHDFLASMGPPLFSDGNPTSRNLVARSMSRFNGAAALQRRKQPASQVL